jgi:DmsE family decaheme c-type cytochrome
MSVAQPAACYRCHTDKKELQTIAHPHQIGGVTGINCTTCHTPHGPLREGVKTDLCLKCHNGIQTSQWHSSSHSLEGVACTDCHNPHPRSNVPRLVEISSTHVTRPTRLPMTVEQPGVCYKCHPKIAGRVNLPSRHPIREGKMVCSDCHDVHRRRNEGIDAETINLLCYECHAEKRGPFVYEHPPVTENCCYCHEPHGTMEKNLMRQATSFLCLRCHTGHRRDPNRFRHWSSIDGNPAAQQALYSDCVQCHFEIHGTNFPSITRIGPIIENGNF